MAAPTLVSSDSTTYLSSGSPKTLSITTQAGDTVFVCAMTIDFMTVPSTPTGNGITFQTLYDNTLSGSTNGMIAWAGVDATGGTNWTLSSTSASSGWGMTCFVFRDTDGFDNMYYNEAFDTSAEGTTPVDWLWDNSAMVVMVNDALGESVTGWMTVNSYTPTLGNGGVEVQAVSSGTIGFHVGCYPDNGPAGSALFGINAGGIMSYGFLAIEVLGSAGGGSGGNTATVSWLKA